MSIPLEHDYIGLSEISSMEKRSSDSSSCTTEEKKKSNTNVLLNLKETELRLGLPGSESRSPPPEWKTGLGVSFFGKDLEDKTNNSNSNGYSSSVKNFVSGAKRGFSESDFGKGSVLFSPRSGGINGGLLNNNNNNTQQPCLIPPQKNGVEEKKASPPNQPPAAKAQVVGWPPIRSFRKNTMATTNNVSKNGDVVEANNSGGSGCVYVKVSMDGAPYLRKVDLKTYSNYAQLSSALEKMFSCFTIGQCSSHGVPGREGLSASRLMDIVNCSEYVLTYEDKDGDWMLVGDVPWDMFTDSCKRLRIMKGSEAIGLAPRAMEKCKNRN